MNLAGVVTFFFTSYPIPLTLKAVRCMNITRGKEPEDGICQFTDPSHFRDHLGGG